MYCGLDEAIPFGLILTELVSNALKHGFPRGRGRRIRVSLRPVGGDHLELCVRDDGIGIPEGVGLGRPKTFGLQLVRDLARQLHGALSFQTDSTGTAVTLSFHNPEPALSAA